MTRSDAVQNRQQIMDAFHEATRRDAITLPTMSEIVKLSGLGRGTVYRHFPDVGSLAFSFLSSGYETLYDESREKLRAISNPNEARVVLKDHLDRNRAFSKENMAILLRPECLTSEGYALAQRSLRQCVRRAIREMSEIGKSASPHLETVVDVISRVAEPEHLKATGVNHETADNLASSAIQMALEFADTFALKFRSTITPQNL
ncbi:MAG: TetR/AcrR family transcriptional regulator [Sneathiella sp.]